MIPLKTHTQSRSVEIPEPVVEAYDKVKGKVKGGFDDFVKPMRREQHTLRSRLWKFVKIFLLAAAVVVIPKRLARRSHS